MIEKRRFIRFEINLEVDYIVKKEPRVEKKGATKDICAGGINLLTDEKLEVGEEVELKMFLSKALNPAHLNGVVVWSKDDSSGEKLSHSAGIEFKAIEEDNKNSFLKFLCDLMYKKVGKE